MISSPLESPGFLGNKNICLHRRNTVELAFASTFSKYQLKVLTDISGSDPGHCSNISTFLEFYLLLSCKMD